MVDHSLDENDELLGMARRYFAHLAAGPVPRSVESGAPFTTQSPASTRQRLEMSAPVTFAVVALLLLAVFIGAGHLLTTRRSASVTPPPTASAVRPTATPPPGGSVPAVLNGGWLQTNATQSPAPVLTFYNGNKFELQISSHAFGGGVSFGSVVVNGNEIDLFTGDACGIPLPGGVGRYRWTLQNGVLHLTPLTVDPCSMRGLIVANRNYIRQKG